MSERSFSSIQNIITGESSIVLTGGVENMSQAPFNVRNIRFGTSLGQNINLEDSLWLGLTDTYCKLPMALTAEKLGEKYGITRAEADAFSLRSQQLWKAGEKSVRPLKWVASLEPCANNNRNYSAANDAGYFKEEIAPVTVQIKRKDVVVDVDEHPRPQTTPEGLAKLPTVFKKDGLVTAGTASVSLHMIRHTWFVSSSGIEF